MVNKYIPIITISHIMTFVCDNLDMTLMSGVYMYADCLSQEERSKLLVLLCFIMVLMRTIEQCRSHTDVLLVLLNKETG